MAQVGVEIPVRQAGQDVASLSSQRDGADLALEHDDANDDESTPLAHDILVIPTDYTLETLHTKWRNNDIVIPNFERGYVWGLPQASKLIESFMMGLPVPPVYLSTIDEQKSVVIDGLQRLLTIFSYLEGAFPENTPYGGREFRIAGINKDHALYGRTFDELGDEDSERLKNSTLRAMTIVHNDPADRSSIYEIFERLNTGGTQLTAQEVRSCVYQGPLSKLLEDLNGLGEWRAVLGRPSPDPRMKDRELVLRCMALFHDGDRYVRPMKGFLSDFMGSRSDPGDVYLDAERQRFVATCRAVTENLGPAPFNNPHGQLRVPLLDSVFVAFANNGAAACPDDISERFEILRADPEFGLHTGTLSTTTGAVRGRLRLAHKTLFE